MPGAGPPADTAQVRSTLTSKTHQEPLPVFYPMSVWLLKP